LSGILRRLEPAVLLGTGGYAAGLALAAARSAHIPYALQEQNSFPGLTQRFFSKGAREIYLGFPEAGRYLKRGRGTTVIDTGNPIEPPPEMRLEREAALKLWGFHRETERVLLVVGGSQGAKPINSAVAAAVHTLNSGGTRVIWATGTAHYNEFQNLNSEKTRVVAYLSPISKAYAVADFAVCRAGAITTAELCAWGIPSLLVPLPTAAADHQNANARALEAAGCAVVTSQTGLTSEHLVSELQRILSDESRLEKMRTAARLRGRPQAAETIATRLLEISHVR
jgi:UDP-N-acetylglucosamine--N-acetylmuramyl-(pentapeptide) pyrophosphoryl-undecaprenol N-acetylglucosamine transferase